MRRLDDEQLEAMRNDPTSAIFDYQVSSAERFKHVNNDMFMIGSQDSNSHSPLIVYIRSKSAASPASCARDIEPQNPKPRSLESARPPGPAQRPCAPDTCAPRH